MGDVRKSNEEILCDLCVSNGLCYDKLTTTYAADRNVLEMFFSGYPRMVGLNLFPRLETLVLIGQAIDVIVGLETCVCLRELWICECNLKVIGGLEHCSSLEQLHLYSNCITQIENVAHLVKLQKLWLNDNRITAIEGLDDLTKLWDLNLAQNRIKVIGKSLSSCSSIEILNLSGNPISSFKDLTNLADLPNLSSLSLQDPLFGPAPVCLQCNYATHVLYHLPQLTHLDTFSVTSQALRELVEMTVVRKKVYYGIQQRVLQHQLNDKFSKRAKEVKGIETRLESRLRRLLCEVKQIQLELNDESSLLTENEEDICKNDRFIAKQSALMQRINELEGKLQLLRAWYDTVKDCLISEAEMRKQMLLLELQTGGNVSYEVGKPGDVWYSSCCDLIQNGFRAADYETGCFSGVRVTNVFKVQNRILRMEFNSQLEAALEREDIVSYTKGQNFKDLIEYFFVVRNSTENNQNEALQVMEHGIKPSVHQGAVCLTNNLCAAERHSLNQLFKQSESFGTDKSLLLANKKGFVVIAKVFTGRTMPINSKIEMKRSNYHGADSVFSHIDNVSLVDKSDMSKVESRCISVAGSNSCYALWFLFDHKMALPEYLVEYEHICQTAPLTLKQIAGFESVGDSGNDMTTTGNSNDKLADTDVLSLQPVFPQRPRLVMLTPDLLLRHCAVSSLESVRVLNVHNNGLSQLQLLDTMPELRKLVVSHNELFRVDGIVHLEYLRYLDLSHNNLITLEGLHNLTRLQHIDVSWNRLENIRTTLLVLRKHCPSLTSLDLRHNPWRKRENLRFHVLGRLKQLQSLDQQPVTEEDMSFALRLLLSYRVSVTMLLSRSCVNESEAKSLDLRSTAEVISDRSRNRPERLDDDDTVWFTKITTLNLDGQGLSKLSNVDKLVNLKWASFAHNYISKIEGLEACRHLLELSLEDNCITRIEGLAHLTFLERLNLSHNTITSLNSFSVGNLHHLQRLNIDNNQITTLEGLQDCLLLFMVFAANNRIANSRNVCCLKTLQNFMILDLYGNPVTETEKYRLLIVFHLQTLRSLDGIVIEAAESNLAKETFGGRLTQDFIADRIGNTDFTQLTKADFSHLGVKQVDLGNAQSFQSLTSLNLEHNELTSLEGLTALTNLKILCLNHNRVESLFANKAKPVYTGGKNAHLVPSSFYADATPILTKLQVLHLGHNGIVDMTQLQLQRFPALQSLFLQANEIVIVDGLFGVTTLKELVLDRNRIKSIGADTFASLSNLVELHLEENRLKDLSHFDSLQSLSRLYLGMNRISDLAELEKLSGLTNLKEISVISNPVSKKQAHRPMLVFRLSQLESIDGIEVTEEEATKADVFFIDQLQTSPALADSRGFQGNCKVPAKVTQMLMNFGTRSDGNDWQSARPALLANFGPQATNALHRREYHGNGRKPRGDSGFPVSDMANTITGVNGQLYHGTDRSLQPRPLGVGRQAASHPYSSFKHLSAQSSGFDWNQSGSPSQKNQTRRSGPSN